MPSVYDLKPAFQGLLRPLVLRLARSGVTPNQVTVAALVLSLAHGAFLLQSNVGATALWLLPVVLLLRMGLNAIDGMLAREHDMKTPVGAVLNELGDVVSDAALYLPFTAVPGLHAPAAVLFVLVAALSEMTGVVGVQIGASRRYDGPMGKSDRALAMSCLAVAVALGAPSALTSVALWVFVGLGVLTTGRRASRALQEVRSCPSN